MELKFSRVTLLTLMIIVVNYRFSTFAMKDTFNDDPNIFNFVETAKVVDKKATCDDKFIYFNLVFNQPFRGLIYSEGSFRVEKCIYVNGTHRPSTRYNVSIPLNDCNSQKFGNGTSQNVLIVQQDPKIMEVDDNFYFITCQILDPLSSLSPVSSAADHFRRIGGPNANQSTFGGGFGLSSDDFPDNERRITLSFLGLTVQIFETVPKNIWKNPKFLNLIEYTPFLAENWPKTTIQSYINQNNAPSTEIVTNVAPISLDYSAEVQLGAGAPNSPPVDRVLRVGEPLSYVVRLRNLKNLDARVGRCWATDRQGSDIQLSDDDGCSLQTGPNSKIWSEFRLYPDRTHDADKILYNDIKTWAFPTSNRVHIYCNLHMCLQKCPEILCDNSNGSKGRRQPKKRTKRRSSVEDSIRSNDTFRLETGYEVSKFLNTENEKRQSELLIAVENDKNDVSNPKICLSEKNFLLGLIFLLLIIFFCIIFIGFLIFRACWRFYVLKNSKF